MKTIKKSWDIVKKAFSLSLKIDMTTTKLLAWAIFIWGFIIIEKIPLEGRAFHIIGILGTVTALYGIKKIESHFDKEAKGGKDDSV